MTEMPLRTLNCGECRHDTFRVGRVTNLQKGVTFDVIQCATCDDEWIPLEVAQQTANQTQAEGN